MSFLSRLALIPLSAINALAGLTLATIAGFSDAVPGWVAAPAMAMAIQGLYTLGWLTHLVKQPQRIGLRLFVSGEIAAAALGTIGLAVAIVNQAGTSDPEYGPLTMLTLVTVHAGLGLVAGFSERPHPIFTA